MRVTFFLLLCAWCCITSPAAAQVKIDGGTISGATNAAGDIHVFKGIPFAAPPVGALRWKAPQPVKPWTGIKACTAFGPSPMQDAPEPFSMWTEEFLIRKEPIGEDCLYLNVWTGAKAATEKRPVLVWIYGGGFGSGGANCPIYDGEAMAKKGIIFVSINYRVGIFGFFAHPELTKESGHNASGNYGLMDQIAALKWVQKNIAAFGGDPSNVTIAGQSAGSMSVNALIASPLAKNLFHRAIGESGAMFTNDNLPLAKAEEAGINVMTTLKAASLKDLRAIPADSLQHIGHTLRHSPIIDGYVLPEPIVTIFKAGKETKVDLLTGWNQDEGLFFGLQNYTWANIQAAQGTPVYLYRFVRKPPATGEYVKYGAFHTGEVPYAYDNLQFVRRPWEPVDHTLATEMSAYWANFTATGDPNGQGLPRWDRYTTGNKQVMFLDTTSKSGPLPDADTLDNAFKKQSVAQTPKHYELQAGKYRLTAEGAARGDYMGEHWLASFAVYALTMQ
jgi:para-nitrobenzyl esterase